MPMIVLALAGKEGVFLGAADDQTGDDVDDFHGEMGCPHSGQTSAARLRKS